MHGGAADRSGLISCGDEVIEVNGINVEGKTPNDVLKILVRKLSRLFVFTIIVNMLQETVSNFINRSTFYFSNLRRIRLPSNSSQTKESKSFVNQGCDYELFLITIQVMINTFHVKKPDYLSVKEISFISLARTIPTGKV